MTREWLRRDRVDDKDHKPPASMVTADTHNVLAIGRAAGAAADRAARGSRAVSSLRWRQCVCCLQSMGAAVPLAGCTMVGPNFVAPAAPVLAKWEDADAAVVTRGPAEQIQCWEAFHDPVLSRLIEIATRNNYNLKIAGLRVLEARAQLGIAVGMPYPQVQQANGSATYTAASLNAANTKGGDLRYWEYNVGASVSWELDFWASSGAASSRRTPTWRFDRRL